MNVTEVLDNLGIDYTVRGDEAEAPCPQHKNRTGSPDHNPSWSINIDTGASFCFSCGYKAGLTTLVSDMLGINYQRAVEWILSNTSIESLETAVSKAGEYRRIRIPTRFADEALYLSFDDPSEEMLASRSITAEAAARYGVKTYQDAWILPIHDAQGRFIGWQEKAGKRVRNRPMGVTKSNCLFGLEQVNSEVVFVVESPLDAVLGYSVGLESCVALFGARASDEQVQLLSGFLPVLALDNDEAGRAAQQQLSDDLSRIGVRHKLLEWPGHMKDFGDHPEEIPNLFAIDPLMQKMRDMS